MREWKNYSGTGANVVVDSDFKIGNKYYLVKSSQQGPTDGHTLLLNRATSICKLSERGIWMIGGSFPRLKDPLKFEELGEKKVILKLMVLLYNYQTSQLDINQIMSSFCEQTGYFGHAGIGDDVNGLV